MADFMESMAITSSAIKGTQRSVAMTKMTHEMEQEQVDLLSQAVERGKDAAAPSPAGSGHKGQVVDIYA